MSSGFANFGSAQTFTNGDLNGGVGFVSVPTSWTQIPFTDASCTADSGPSATVDVLDASGPSAGGGVAGIPFSGSTFCSGLHAGNGGGGLVWHEGIMQTVTGFTIGNTYAISFYQAVVKQTNCIDQSGSWRVYLNGTLLTTTVVSTSALAPDDINLVWDNRVVNFTATATSHVIKFIPWDDDADHLNSSGDLTGALRMGIDLITFTAPLPIELVRFSGEQIGNNATLNWETATEKDNDYFIIERSIDGKDWLRVGVVDGAGNSAVLNSYSLVDRNAPFGINYYRLKQRDIDGVETVADVLVVSDNSAEGILLSPNPAKGLVSVSFAESFTKIQALDLNGHVLKNVEFDNCRKASFDLGGLDSGVYILQITTDSGIKTKRINVL